MSKKRTVPMKAYKVNDHLKEKKRDPYFKEFYELEVQKYSIIEEIIKYRVENGLTQGQLAEKVGVTQQQISKVENGEFSSIMTLERILLAIGMTVQIKAVPLKKVRQSAKKKAILELTKKFSKYHGKNKPVKLTEELRAEIWSERYRDFLRRNKEG